MFCSSPYSWWSLFRSQDLSILYVGLKRKTVGSSTARAWAASVQFSRSVASDSPWPHSPRPHESQHARPPCPSPTPGVHSDPRPSSQWCHPAISSSVIPFSSCPQSFPASESFPLSQHVAWGGQSTGVSALASFLPKKSQGWSSEWTGWISLQSKGLSRVFSKRRPTYMWVSSNGKYHSATGSTVGWIRGCGTTDTEKGHVQRTSYKLYVDCAGGLVT